MDIEKAMNFLKNTVTRDNGFSPVFIANMDILIGYAEEQLTDRWIPVSERLPNEEDISQLHYSHPNHRKFLCTIQIANYKPQIRLLYFGEMGWLYEGENYDEYVIAWQPLPEPYKEKPNEG
ncbi:DUF551 domain-containing protein [Tissierella praeacuta]|uniref:DUF551 domain-containing protein n=1 Tax=Tissierella praeacuta TaxID=43131 RepID=UPI00104CB3C6|nr:DUF551 domain-containing protein [Tissierella praeacuta]TCU72872.1 uncharacterized protein DUF551 [Tissierella praeacuta]